MEDVPIGARFVSLKCLCNVVRGLVSLIIYLFVEFLLFCVVVGASHGISWWIQGIFFAVTWHHAGPLLQTYFLVYPVGIMAAQVTKYYHDLVPSRHFWLRRRCPLFFGVLRMLIIISTILGGTWFLFQSYDWKYNEGGDCNEEEKMRRIIRLKRKILSDEPMLNCDSFFCLAVLLLAYVYARVTESYREVSRKKVELKYWRMRPRRVVQWPAINLYLSYFGALVLLEVVVTLVCASVLVLHCIILQSLFQKAVVTFIVSCLSGAVLGYVVAILEERWSPFDEFYGKLEPFSETIHWDARQYIIVFTILPGLSRWYYTLQFEEESGPFFNFSVYAGSAATTLLVFVKCQTFFSFMIPEEEEDGPHPFQLRIHPEVGEQGGVPNQRAIRRRRAGRNWKLGESLLGGLPLLFRSILSPHLTSSLMNRMASTTPPEELVTLPPAPVFTNQQHFEAPCSSSTLAPAQPSDTNQNPPNHNDSSPAPLPPTAINCNMLLFSTTLESPSILPKPPHFSEALPFPDKENNNHDDLGDKKSSTHAHFVQTSTPPPSPPKEEERNKLRSSRTILIVPTHEKQGNIKESRAITIRKCQATVSNSATSTSSSSEHNHLE